MQVKLKSRTAIFISAFVLFSGATFAGNGPSAASANSSAALSLVTGSIVIGSASMLSEAGKFTVEAIESTGNSVVIVLKNASDGATISIKTVGASVGAASVGIGTIVSVVTEASGYAIMASGKVIAFIPNAIGKSLIHSKKTSERGVRT